MNPQLICIDNSGEFAGVATHNPDKISTDKMHVIFHCTLLVPDLIKGEGFMDSQITYNEKMDSYTLKGKFVGGTLGQIFSGNVNLKLKQ